MEVALFEELLTNELTVPAVRAEQQPGFECIATSDGLRTVWVRARGEIDLLTAPELELTVRRAEHHDVQFVVLDLREDTFMDSSGVHLIVDASRRARRAGRRLVALVGGAPQVHRLLMLTGLDGLLEIIENPSHARRLANGKACGRAVTRQASWRRSSRASARMTETSGASAL